MQSQPLFPVQSFEEHQASHTSLFPNTYLFFQIFTVFFFLSKLSFPAFHLVTLILLSCLWWPHSSTPRKRNKPSHYTHPLPYPTLQYITQYSVSPPSVNSIVPGIVSLKQRIFHHFLDITPNYDHVSCFIKTQVLRLTCDCTPNPNLIHVIKNAMCHFQIVWYFSRDRLPPKQWLENTTRCFKRPQC